jgi:uncharacterized protein YwgA
VFEVIIVLFKMSEVEELMGDLSLLQKYIILLLGAKGQEPIKGNTWFQKELYILAENVPLVAKEASFDSDFYGPFSENAKEQLDDLVLDGVVDKQGNKMFLSGLGVKIEDKLKKTVPKEELELIEDYKDLLNDLSDDELLTFIYFSFPSMTDESWVLDKIKKNRVNVALKLYHKEKISLEKAAEIAGMPVEELMGLIKKK